MTDTAKHRGHPIQYIDGKWEFVEGPQRGKYGKERTCTKCHAISDTHDSCLGHLANVRVACCGHGATKDAYIAFEDGRVLRGRQAVELRHIWVGNPMTPAGVIQVFMFLNTLEATRALCELSRYGYHQDDLVCAARLLSPSQPLTYQVGDE
jgi:hypothetical protein